MLAPANASAVSSTHARYDESARPSAKRATSGPGRGPGQVSAATYADWALLVLCTETAGQVELAAHVNLALTAAQREALCAGHGFVGLALQDPGDRLVTCFDEDETFRSCPRLGFETASLLLSPITLEGRLLGLVVLGGQERGQFDLYALHLTRAVSRRPPGPSSTPGTASRNRHGPSVRMIAFETIRVGGMENTAASTQRSVAARAGADSVRLDVCDSGRKQKASQGRSSLARLVFLVGDAELESATSCVSSKRSNQLSYRPRVARTLRYRVHPCFKPGNSQNAGPAAARRAVEPFPSPGNRGVLKVSFR